MRKALIILIGFFMATSSIETKAQIVASMYNQGRNSNCCGTYRENGHGRFGRVLLGTGLIAGGIAVAAVSGYQEYYVPNTMIYGTGAIMTLIGTSLVITGLNVVNREINLVYTGNSVGIRINLNEIENQNL